MHDTAYEHSRLFFELYGADLFRTVVELGSQDVNGSLRDHCPPSVHYIGLDIVAAKGVDVVVSAGGPLPLMSETADAVLTSSAFEHDVCFWGTFLELVRILRPGGLLYLNAPSNGGFHRHPLDCWRFYPDAGVALVQWALRGGSEIALVESFIGEPQAEAWADFVAVFRKAGGTALNRRGRIADHVPAINIHDFSSPTGQKLQAESESMPDMRIAKHLRNELTATRETLTQHNANLSAQLATAMQHNQTLSHDLAAAGHDVTTLRRKLNSTEQRARELEERLDQTSWELAALRNSTSWRMTSGLRALMGVIRGR